MTVRAVVLFLILTCPAFAQDTIAFVDVSVLPMDENRILTGQTVVVSGGTITAMGPSADITLPTGAAIVEGAGRFLMPGLAEMHGHLPNTGGDIPARWTEDVLFLYAANGVTTVRGMQGNASHLVLRDRIDRREVLGPRLLVSSPQYSGRSARSPNEAAERVRADKAAGFDHLKIQEGLQAEVYDAIVRTAKEVDIPFAGHVPDEVGLFAALEAGQQTIDHLDNGFTDVDGDQKRIREIVKAYKEAGAWSVPTEALWEFAFLAPRPAAEADAARPEVRYVPEPIRQQWRESIEGRLRAMQGSDEGQQRIAFRRKLLKALQDGDVGILLGTDSPQIYSVPGFSIHLEIAVMAESGLSPYEILHSGTRAVAEFLAETDTSGTVAVDRRADLILTEGNPLEDLTRLQTPVGVVLNGQWLNSAQIQNRLSQIETAYTN